jgi:DnaJ-domain-containing protein 1
MTPYDRALLRTLERIRRIEADREIMRKKVATQRAIASAKREAAYAKLHVDPKDLPWAKSR